MRGRQAIKKPNFDSVQWPLGCARVPVPHRGPLHLHLSSRLSAVAAQQTHRMQKLNAAKNVHEGFRVTQI